MLTNIGVWLDRRKAVVVSLQRATRSFENPKETTSIVTIASDVDRRVRLSGGSRTGNTPWGPQQAAVDSKIEDRQKQQLKQYYRRIVHAVASGGGLLIMGPGEAKLELKKALEKQPSTAAKIIAMETRDKMTERQITARVRAFFNER
jgi:hypothetical protein